MTTQPQEARMGNVTQEARDALAKAYEAEGLGVMAQWMREGSADNSSHRPALLALATALAEREGEGEQARIAELEAHLGKLVNFIGRLPATLPTAEEQDAFEAARDVCWEIEARATLAGQQ